MIPNSLIKEGEKKNRRKIRDNKEKRRPNEAPKMFQSVAPIHTGQNMSIITEHNFLPCSNLVKPVRRSTFIHWQRINDIFSGSGGKRGWKPDPEDKVPFRTKLAWLSRYPRAFTCIKRYLAHAHTCPWLSHVVIHDATRSILKRI